MEHAKAKKAKGKAEKALAQMMMEAEMAKASEADLQPEDGYINLDDNKPGLGLTITDKFKSDFKIIE